jgi:hypothetical protein
VICDLAERVVLKTLWLPPNLILVVSSLFLALLLVLVFFSFPCFVHLPESSAPSFSLLCGSSCTTNSLFRSISSSSVFILCRWACSCPPANRAKAVLLSATTAQSVLVLLTVSSPGFPLPPQFVTVPARVPGTQSDLQFILSWVRTLALILVAGARLCSAVSSHCSRLGLCCLILDFPPGAKRILILVKILTGGFPVLFLSHIIKGLRFSGTCALGVFS